MQGGAPCRRQPSNQALNLQTVLQMQSGCFCFVFVLRWRDKTIKNQTQVFVALVLSSSNHIMPVFRRDDISWGGEKQGNNSWKHRLWKAVPGVRQDTCWHLRVTGTPFPVVTAPCTAADRQKVHSVFWSSLGEVQLRSEQHAYSEGYVLNSDENKEQMESIITIAPFRTINVGEHMPRANTNSPAL